MLLGPLGFVNHQPLVVNKIWSDPSNGFDPRHIVWAWSCVDRHRTSVSFEEIVVILLVAFLLCFGTAWAGTSPGWSGPEGLGAPLLRRLDFPPFPPPLPLSGSLGACCWPAGASRTSAVGCFFSAFCLKQRVDDASMAQDYLFLMGLVDHSNICIFLVVTWGCNYWAHHQTPTTNHPPKKMEALHF